jgi:hypothetical protein
MSAFETREGAPLRVLVVPLLIIAAMLSLSAIAIVFIAVVRG